jgi:hypothetical protein
MRFAPASHAAGQKKHSDPLRPVRRARQRAVILAIGAPALVYRRRSA